MWLCAPQAHQIWSCLAERAVFPVDRELCFKWFSKLMGDEPDLDPNINQEFFKQNILQLDPALLTESGIRYDGGGGTRWLQADVAVNVRSAGVVSPSPSGWSCCFRTRTSHEFSSWCLVKP